MKQDTAELRDVGEMQKPLTVNVIRLVFIVIFPLSVFTTAKSFVATSNV